MRRISACLCAAVLVLTAVLSVSASDDYVFETMLTPNTDEAAVGEVVTVECNVYGITDVNGLIAIDTTIEYDPSVLEYRSAVSRSMDRRQRGPDSCGGRRGRKGKGIPFLCQRRTARQRSDRRLDHRHVALPCKGWGRDGDRAAHLQRRQYICTQRSWRNGLRQRLRSRSAHCRRQYGQDHYLLCFGCRHSHNGAAVYETAQIEFRKEMRGK